jgi:hypothetical protein
MLETLRTILVDGRSAQGRRRGIGVYAWHLLSELQQQALRAGYQLLIALAAGSPDPWPDNQDIFKVCA